MCLTPMSLVAPASLPHSDAYPSSLACDFFHVWCASNHSSTNANARQKPPRIHDASVPSPCITSTNVEQSRRSIRFLDNGGFAISHEASVAEGGARSSAVVKPSALDRINHLERWYIKHSSLE